MVILLILKHIQKQWRMALHTLLQNIQVKQKNVHTMVHLKKEHMVGLLGLENITTQEQEWKIGVQFLPILDVNGELTEQKQYLLGGVLTVILQDLLEPITEVDSSQTKKAKDCKILCFFYYILFKESSMNTKKYFITLFSFIIFSIYFTLSGVFVPFIASIPQSNGGFKTLSSQNDFYKMVDNFYDPDEFYNFRTDNQNINILANFYNTLNASSNFDVLTSFNQAIAVDIDDFNGDQRFYYNSDEFIDNSQSPTINIKALQLNQKAYDFYNIKVEGNSGIAWNSISYKDDSIPVLLGSEYKSFYKIGDIITGNYYSKNTNFEVIGFIETDCSINYKNTSNITLNTYMLIPYPSTLWEVDKTNFQFESLLYFAMINCDLLPFVEESQILKNIKSISDETGFSDFSLVGIDNFQIQHIELLLFIQKNHILFIIGFLIIFILLNILCLYLFSHILKSIYNQSTLRKKHNKIFMLNIVIPYGSAFLLGTSLATLFIKKILPISIIIGIITLALIYLINYLFLSKFLHFSSNLQQ